MNQTIPRICVLHALSPFRQGSVIRDFIGLVNQSDTQCPIVQRDRMHCTPKSNGFCSWVSKFVFAILMSEHGRGLPTELTM